MKSGYDQTKQGELYALKSKCGTMVKIGISNNTKRRLSRLKLATPFAWECVKVVSGQGGIIAGLEKKLHSITEQVIFSDKFDGYTEWRVWDDRILGWIDSGL
ncbi:MAG: GIY-YIG nuclease family protein [Shewanella sp.]